MKTIKGDLILKKDTTFKEDLKVEGDIKGWFDLKVLGNIDARNINARNIDAWDIICEKRIKKYKTSKTICRVFVTDKSKLERKEQIEDTSKEKKE